MKNAKEIYMNYIKEMNDEETTRELIAYQNYGDSFAIMSLTTKSEYGNWTDYILIRLDYYENVDPIRTFSRLHDAKIALLALAYRHTSIIYLPF